MIFQRQSLLRNVNDFKTLNILILEFPYSKPNSDKVEYQGYFDKSIELLRVGGIIAVDNVLWGGSVIDESVQNLSTIAIREFNRKLKTDPRVSISMLPIGDGLTLARKL